MPVDILHAYQTTAWSQIRCSRIIENIKKFVIRDYYLGFWVEKLLQADRLGFSCWGVYISECVIFNNYAEWESWLNIETSSLSLRLSAFDILEVIIPDIEVESYSLDIKYSILPKCRKIYEGVIFKNEIIVFWTCC